MNCICGKSLSSPGPHSLHFLKYACESCGSVSFQQKNGERGQDFSYEFSRKYVEEPILLSSVMRWPHIQIANHLLRNSETILEIGCFNGSFVRLLRDKGFDAYGIDINSKAIESGCDANGLLNYIFTPSATPSGLRPNVLIGIDVLEHLEDPCAFISELLAKYTSVTKVIISGPTTTRIFHDKSDFPPHHLWWFSELGLCRMLSNQGFSVESSFYERSLLLLARNIAGRVLYGLRKREFYGEGSSIVLTSYTGKASLLMRCLNIVGKCFPFPKYCSVIIVASKASSVTTSY